MSHLDEDDEDFFEDDDMEDDEGGPNVRASSYFIVESSFVCGDCDEQIPVYAFGLPADHQLLMQNGDDGELQEWVQPNVTVTLSGVSGTPESVIRHVQAITQNFRLAANEESDDPWWMNFCPECGSELNEMDLHEEISSPFGEYPYFGRARIRLWKVDEPFEASAQVSSDVQDTPLIPK